MKLPVGKTPENGSPQPRQYCRYCNGLLEVENLSTSTVSLVGEARDYKVRIIKCTLKDKMERLALTKKR